MGLCIGLVCVLAVELVFALHFAFEHITRNPVSGYCFCEVIYYALCMCFLLSQIIIYRIIPMQTCPSMRI